MEEMNNITTLINQHSIQKIVNTVAPGSGHRTLIKALQQHFPSYNFHLMTEHTTCWHKLDGRLLDADGVEVSPSWRTWLSGQFDEYGQDVLTTFKAVRDMQYRITRYHGCDVYVAVKTGDRAQDFIQIKIDYILNEQIKCLLCSGDTPYYRESLDDLYSIADDSHYSFESVVIADSGRYEQVVMTNTAQHLELALECYQAKLHHDIETLTFNVTSDPGAMVSTQTRVDDGTGQYTLLDIHPEALDYEIGYKRLFDDWNRSSAGKSGAVFYVHWFLQFKDNEKYRRAEEFRELYAIPGWCSKKKLPEIKLKNNDTIYSLTDRLTKFDNKIGHPFAWYFFMLHGNRIKHDVGEFVAKAIKSGDFNLPQHDEIILLKWHDSQYGF